MIVVVEQKMNAENAKVFAEDAGARTSVYGMYRFLLGVLCKSHRDLCVEQKMNAENAKVFAENAGGRTSWNVLISSWRALRIAPRPLR
jgi:hypothetical protein